MATNTQLGIIAHLLNQEEPQTIRGIAKALKKSYPLVYNAIQDLAKKEIIFKKNAPPAHIIELNPYAPLRLFLEAEWKRTQNFLNLHKWVQVFLTTLFDNVGSSFFSLLIFGSYAKRTFTVKSDIDLLIVVPTAENIVEMTRIVREIYTPVMKHTIVVTEKDALEMIIKAKQFNVGNEAQKHHIILYGAENYYALLRKSYHE